MSYRDNGGTEDGDSEHGGVERQGREGAVQQRPPHTPVITNLPTGGCPSSCVHIHRIIIIIITIIVETKLAEDLVSTVGDDLDDLIIEVNGEGTDVSKMYEEMSCSTRVTLVITHSELNQLELTARV